MTAIDDIGDTAESGGQENPKVSTLVALTVLLNGLAVFIVFLLVVQLKQFKKTT